VPKLGDDQRESLRRFKGLLEACVKAGGGLYVTF
jgi:hypothetical protein